MMADVKCYPPRTLVRASTTLTAFRDHIPNWSPFKAQPRYFEVTKGLPVTRSAILRPYVRIGLLLFAILNTVGCRDDGDPIVDTERSVYISPLLYSFDHWDHHLLQWLPDHPRYEIVEALIKDSAPPVIQFFFTERAAKDGSKKQFHYTNDQAFAGRLARGAGDSEVEFVDIDYTPPNAGEIPRFYFGLDALEGPITWQFCASGEPDPQYGSGLVNNVTENAHNPKGGLLFFYLPESTTSDACTVLDMGDSKYPAAPWPEVSVPPYFVAYRAVYSRNIDLGYFYASDRTRIRVNSAPSELTRGAMWSVTLEGASDGIARDANLEVLDVRDKSVTLTDGTMTYVTTLEKGELTTTDIQANDGVKSMNVHFASPVPDLRNLDDKKHEVAFTMATESATDLSSGVLSIQRVNGGISVGFLPQNPEFLQAASLMTAIQLTEDGYILESHTLYPQSTGND
jgi:hypothetical protein